MENVCVCTVGREERSCADNAAKNPRFIWNRDLHELDKTDQSPDIFLKVLAGLKSWSLAHGGQHSQVKLDS